MYTDHTGELGLLKRLVSAVVNVLKTVVDKVTGKAIDKIVVEEKGTPEAVKAGAEAISRAPGWVDGVPMGHGAHGVPQRQSSAIPSRLKRERLQPPPRHSTDTGIIRLQGLMERSIPRRAPAAAMADCTNLIRQIGDRMILPEKVDVKETLKRGKQVAEQDIQESR